MDPSLLQAWSDVVENMNDAMFILARQGNNGRILYLNSAATRMFGYERGDVLDQSIEMLIHDHARAPHIQATHPLLGRRQDGSTFPLEVLITPKEQGIAPATILVARDARYRRPSRDSLQPARDADRTIKILHIEDNLRVARSMARVLRLEGYEVVSVATRHEVMQQLDIQGLRPDLILTDFQLRLGITSDAIVAEIAARLHCRPPTIMLTSNPGRNIEQARSFADRVLTKPVDVDVLMREIESLMHTRR
jgi:PAS domain S-box-containing protein